MVIRRATKRDKPAPAPSSTPHACILNPAGFVFMNGSGERAAVLVTVCGIVR
jgi:hypothetical protein